MSHKIKSSVVHVIKNKSTNAHTGRSDEVVDGVQQKPTSRPLFCPCVKHEVIIDVLVIKRQYRHFCTYLNPNRQPFPKLIYVVLLPSFFFL